MRKWFSKLLGRTPEHAIDCDHVLELLQFYLDSEIDADRARLIAEHLDECRSCGLEAETYEMIKTSLAAKRPTVPAESVARVREFAEQLARGDGPPGQET
jgi:predicted anti-sigma-YlaC factor YlaD